MKVALVYDRVNKWGGAERVLLALHKIFPNAPLYTSVYDEKKASWAHVFQVKTSFLQNVKLAKRFHEAFAPLMPLAFESFSFDSYDLVISVTSESAKGIITKPPTKHICLCLTPTRYLWSGYNEYFSQKYAKLLSKPLISLLKKWDLVGASRPDYYIAISNTVAKRINKFYYRDSTVIYPPLMLQPIRSKKKLLPTKKDKNFFLVVSRLSRWTPYKRVDLAINAANKLKLPLKIIGEGKYLEKLKKMSGKTVEFLEGLTDYELSYYYKNCKALLFTANEDFGLVMVEAQLFGKPVIAYRAGGACEIVIEGKTGEFFEDQTPESLIEVLKTFREKKYNSRHCRQNAKRFTFDKFEKEIKQLVKKVVKREETQKVNKIVASSKRNGIVHISELQPSITTQVTKIL